MKSVHLLTTLILLPQFSLLAGSAVIAPQLRDAKTLYYQGVYGDTSAEKQSDKIFSSLHQQLPGDPLISVYYGSLRLVEAKNTWALWRKNSLSREGMRLMDSAVKLAPDRLEVRFVRAATEYHLPTYFGRTQQCREEFAYLASRAVSAAHDGSLEPRLAAASLYYHAEFCKEQSRLKDATEALKRATELAPQSHAGRIAAEELKSIESKIH